MCDIQRMNIVYISLISQKAYIPMSCMKIANYRNVVLRLDYAEYERYTTFRNQLNGYISRWAQEYNIYFKRYNSDQFVAYLNQKILAELEDSNFEILSQLREKSVGYRAQLTLSIGVGEGTENLIDLGIYHNLV